MLVALVRLIFILIATFFLHSCFASPAYWNVSKSQRIDILDPDNPEAAKRGWEDGCRAGAIHAGLPTQINTLNEFNIDPYYASDPIYRDAWTYATYHCMAKIKYGTSKKFLESYNYLDQRGDSIAFKK
jgi:hypothetical protein